MFINLGDLNDHVRLGMEAQNQRPLTTASGLGLVSKRGLQTRLNGSARVREGTGISEPPSARPAAPLFYPVASFTARCESIFSPVLAGEPRLPTWELRPPLVTHSQLPAPHHCADVLRRPRPERDKPLHTVPVLGQATAPSAGPAARFGHGCKQSHLGLRVEAGSWVYQRPREPASRLRRQDEDRRNRLPSCF